MGVVIDRLRSTLNIELNNEHRLAESKTITWDACDRCIIAKDFVKSL